MGLERNLHRVPRHPGLDSLLSPAEKAEVLAEINARNRTPLVLHGGSGTSEADFKASIRNGICKINVATALQVAATEQTERYLATDAAPDYIGIKRCAIEASRRSVAYHIRLFESDGKA